MSRETLLHKMAQTVIDGDSEAAVQLLKEALDAGLDPHDCINQGFKPGLDQIGDGFEAGEYFLPDLMVAGKVMESAMGILEENVHGSVKFQDSVGKVVLATVAGDLHNTGKNLVGMMLKLNGFEVLDLEIDVSTATIVERVKEAKPDLLGLSALLSTTTQIQKDVIKELEEIGIRKNVKVLIGGAACSEQWASQIGADGYAKDAAAAVNKAKEVLGIA